MSGAHQKAVATHPDNRISCKVSDEAIKMWAEITEMEEKQSAKRYYPAHTMEKLIKDYYKMVKAGWKFG